MKSRTVCVCFKQSFTIFAVIISRVQGIISIKVPPRHPPLRVFVCMRCLFFSGKNEFMLNPLFFLIQNVYWDGSSPSWFRMLLALLPFEGASCKPRFSSCRRTEDSGAANTELPRRGWFHSILGISCPWSRSGGSAPGAAAVCPPPFWRGVKGVLARGLFWWEKLHTSSHWVPELTAESRRVCWFCFTLRNK